MVTTNVFVVFNRNRAIALVICVVLNGHAIAVVAVCCWGCIRVIELYPVV